MRRRSWLELCAALPLAACSPPREATNAPAAVEPALPFELEDALPAFFSFYDRFERAPLVERVDAFLREVVAKHPAIYAKEVLGLAGPDATRALRDRLLEWLPTLGIRVPAMREVHARFPQDAARAVARFREVLPSFAWRGKCWLFASVDSMNGAVRDVSGEPCLVFGVDVVVKDGTSMPLPVLFAHELFHLHHAAEQRDPGADQRLVDALWFEGLAGYASTLIVPGTSDAQALPMSHVHRPDAPALDVPERRVDLSRLAPELWRALGAELLAALESQDRERYADFFLGRASPALGERPVRTGYWFGLQLARSLGKHRSLEQLVRADVRALRPVLADELARMLAEGPPGT